MAIRRATGFGTSSRSSIGLGRSSTARAYALRDLAEACAYLRDPLLRTRYEEITAAVSDQLAGGRSLEDLMGSNIDALKLVSSLTLFRAASQSLAREDATFDALAQRCDSILQQAAGQGYPPCAQTLARCYWLACVSPLVCRIGGFT